MIPNQWYAIAESREVAAGSTRAMRRLGEDLALWRDAAGQLSVMVDRCPHRGAQLSLGRVKDGCIQCPFHGFQFNSAGAIELIPANGRNGAKPAVFQCQTQVVREAHGIIWLWHGAPQESYPELPWFDELAGMHAASFQARWDTYYTRAVEGMLDVSHLPFVHARTIGRGGKTLVNGPYTTLEENKIRVWVSNQPDSGLPATRPTEMPPPSGPPMLHFNFPNVWQIRLSEKMRIVNLIVPVDEESTIIYVRAYNAFVKNAFLGRILSSWLNLSNRYILNEDKRVTVSQRPKISGLEIGEHFIPADRPIALYLQQRRKLCEQARS